jgi:hypothetical protein
MLFGHSSGLTLCRRRRIAGAALPEPATWAMALLGFAGLGFAARRRAKLKGRVGFSAA